MVLEGDEVLRRRILATLELHTAADAAEDGGPARRVMFDEVDNVAAAERRVFGQAYDAWILDVWLPDGSGLDLLEHARAQGLRTPALMLTTNLDVRLANRVQILGAEIAYKPDVVANALVFVERVIGVRAPRAGLPAGRLVNEAHIAGLSPRELDVLRATRRGLSRSQVAETLGLSENTVKTMIRRILAKAEARTSSELIDRWRTPLEGLPILDFDPDSRSSAPDESPASEPIDRGEANDETDDSEPIDEP